VTTVETTEVAERFLDALSRRDFAALAATFAEDGRLRGLVPTALREAEGRNAIAERFALWNDSENWQLLDSEIEPVADMIRIRWRVAATDPEAGHVTFEQTAYAEVGERGVTRMNLVCSGERPAG
jgi:hypothetical protein